MSRKPLTDKDGEVRELTAADFKQFRPAKEVLPKALYDILPKSKNGRGKQKKPTKKPVMLRLDPEIVNYFKSLGHGWQSRINDFLKAAVTNLTHL